MEKNNDVNVDGEKRGKLLLLAGFISLVIFVNKMLQSQTDVVVWRVYLDAGIYFAIAFVGLLWAFNFQVKAKSFLYIAQSSLFVLSEAVFVEFFFFQKFSRIYEALILLLLLGIIFVGNYVSFLMANVFNVDLFKKIPLAHVGRTSSYLISLFMMYFLTFSFLSGSIPVYILIPVTIVCYALISLIHYVNIGIEEGNLVRKTFLTTIITVFLFLAIFLSGETYELTAAIPAIGYYFCVSVVTQEQLVRRNNLGIIISIIFIAIISILSLIFNLRG